MHDYAPYVPFGVTPFVIGNSNHRESYHWRSSEIYFALY